MIIRDIKAMSYSEKEFNEDAVGFTKTSTFIIDGASGLTRTNVTNSENDVYWYVNQWKEILEANLDTDKSLKDIMKDGLKIIKARFQYLVSKKKVNPLNYPSAAIAVAKIIDNYIEYFILGDCSIILKKNDGEVCYFKDDRVTEFDDQVIKNIMEENKKNLDQHKVFKGFSQKSLEMLRNNRLKKNTDTGYWILEFDERAIDKGLYGSVFIDDSIKVILMSDGFSLSIDNYGLMDEYTLFDYVKDYGLEKIYKIIRTIEKDDMDCIKYPRLRKSDDCSAVYMDIGK
jgi:hypothetical protein